MKGGEYMSNDDDAQVIPALNDKERIHRIALNIKRKLVEDFPAFGANKYDLATFQCALIAHRCIVPNKDENEVILQALKSLEEEGVLNTYATR